MNLEEEKFLVGIGKDENKTKPENKVKEKKSAMGNYGHYTISEITDLVGKHGHALMPEYLIGGMKQDNFKEMQIFLLDFDGKDERGKGVNISYNAVKARAEKYGLKIAFAYKTFSCPSGQEFYKFRIAFIHEFPIKDKNIATLIYKELNKLFPESDKACAEISRFFLGGKGCIDFDATARFNLMQLQPIIYQILDVNRNFKRNLKNLLSGLDIAIINNRIAIGTEDMKSIFDEKGDSYKYIILKAESRFSSIFYIPISENSLGLHQNITSDYRKENKYRLQFDQCASNCKLLDDFINGKEKLNHMQRFMIATNLDKIKAGLKLMDETMEKYYPQKSVLKWKCDKKYLNYPYPMSCQEDLCPYYKECMRISTQKNIIGHLLNDRRVIVNEQEQFDTLDNVKNLFAENLERAFLSSQRGIHMLKGQTALGKTTMIGELIRKYPDKRILIAEPLNKMKNEIYDDLKHICSELHITIGVTASVRESIYFDKVEKEEYMDLHERGLHMEACKMIKDKLKDVKEKHPDYIDEINELARISDGIYSCNDDQIVITTHAMLLNISEKLLQSFDAVIIDEDILYLQILCNIKHISENILQKVAEVNCFPYSEIAKKMLRAKPNVYYKSNWVGKYRYTRSISDLQNNDRDYWNEDDTEDEIINTGYNDNVNDLTKAGSYICIEDKEGKRTYQYFCVAELPENIKYILLSATADEEIYESYFQGKMDIVKYNYKYARYIGKLKQFTYHSLGRKDIASKQVLYDFVKAYTGNPEIDFISFKSEEEKHYLNKYGIHFGNAVGINDMKGKDIAIIGTFFKHPVAYMLPCCYIYESNSVNGDKLKRQRVEYKGRNFLIMAFSNENLRNFQMYSLESEMEQCIGRARLLRYNCTVYLFSAFPCEQAEIYTEDYLEKYEEEQKEKENQPKETGSFCE